MESTLKNGSFERVIAIADIHGCYIILRQLLEEEIRFEPCKDKIIFLGDYIDFRKMSDAVDRSGVSSAKVVQYVSELKRMHPDNIVLLKGNHEAMAEKAFTSDNPIDQHQWSMNGGMETIISYGGFERAAEVLLPFIKTLELYHETSEAIFVHGGLPSDKTIFEASEDEMLWNRGKYVGKKLLVVGHSITDSVRMIGNKLNIDLGCFMTGRLVGFDVLSRKIYEATGQKSGIKHND